MAIFSGLILSVLIPMVITAAIGFLLVGLGVASIVPISYGIAERSKMYAPSVALALVSTISFFGFLLGPPLIGFVADLFDLQVSFMLISINGLGILLLSSIRKQVFSSQETFSTP
jgi:MFS family permease